MGMREFGELVRLRRESLGLSAMDVAYSVGRAPSWVNRIESGEATHPPEPSIMLALSQVLGIPESDMLTAMGYRFGVAEDRPPYDAELDAITRELAALSPDDRARALRVIRALRTP